MFNELFENNIEMLGDTDESIIAALAACNVRFIEEAEKNESDNPELLEDIIDFGDMFFEEYIEDIESKILVCFHGLPDILSAYIAISNTATEVAILDNIGTKIEKRAQFNIERLKKKINELEEKYKNILISVVGLYIVKDNDVECDLYEIDREEILNEMSEDEINRLLLIAMHSDCRLTIYCADESFNRFDIYGIDIENKNWRNVSKNKLAKEIDTSVLSDCDILGFEIKEFEE